MSHRFAVICLRETTIKKIIPVNFIKDYKSFKTYYPTELHYVYVSNDFHLTPNFTISEYKDVVDYKDGDTGLYKGHVLRTFGKN